jgi:RNA polymerase sigma factor (sigma-70 family)
VTTIDDLVAQHMSLAEQMARKQFGRRAPGISLEDLLGPAQWGLLRAARTWDPEGGSNFRSWATTKIHGAICDWLRAWSHSRPGRSGGISRQPPLSLHDGCMAEAVGLFVPTCPPSVDRLEQVDYLAALRRCLGWRSRVLLRLYYDEGWTQLQIGEFLGLNESWVGMCLRASLRSLRERASQLIQWHGQAADCY